MTAALVISLAWAVGLVGLHALPTRAPEQRPGLDGVPVVACAGLAPDWVDEAQVWASEWWSTRGCDYPPQVERSTCPDDCDGVPCVRGAVSLVTIDATEQAAELTHVSAGSWAVVELPADVRGWEDGALVLAHALGHACGWPDDTRRIGLGRAAVLAPTGQVMSPGRDDLGWGDAMVEGRP